MKEQSKQVLDDWGERTISSSAIKTETKSAALTNLLPEILETLTSLLGTEDAARTVQEAWAKIGRPPSHQRVERNLYSIDQVFWEYHALECGLFDVLEKSERFDLEGRWTVSRALLLAIQKVAANVHGPSKERPPESAQILAHAIPESGQPRSKASSNEAMMAEELLRNLQESEQDYAIFALDTEGYIMTWNQGAVRMKQYTPEEAIGSHFSMLYPEEAVRRDQPMAHLRMAKRDGRYRGEGVRVRKSGELFIADVLITPMFKDGKHIGFSKVVADVTEQGMLERQRDESRAQVKSLEVEKDLKEKFVATLSHDLRNPLTAAKTGLDLIARYECDHPSHSRLARLSLRSIARADQMITDLLDVSRIRAGEPMPIRPEQCDIRKLLMECLQELTSVHGDRFVYEGPNHPVIGQWYSPGLMRVIENLANNAVKYGDPSRNINIRLVPYRDRVKITVHNWGNPLSAEDQVSLFEAFQRSRSAQHGAKQGWGLGLTLVRGIVNAHGGTVTVESTPETGTTFTVDIPRDGRGLGIDIAV